MVSQGSTEHYAYNLTVKATSRAILNAGTGLFSWGAGKTWQWSLPSCETSGTLTVGDSVLEVDGDRSLTWYDRQFGDGGPDTFTWFGIQFPGSNIRASVWVSDNDVPEQRLRFATVRTDYGLSMVRVNVTEDPEYTWTSPNSNNTYHTKWRLDFGNGDFLDVESVREDQEIYSEDSWVASTAFASVKGSFFGQETGYAILDVSPRQKLAL